MFATHILTIGTGLSLLLFHFYDDFNLFVFLMVYLSIGSVLSLMASKHKTIVWMVSIGFICLNESMFKSNESSVHRVTQIWSVLLSLGILTKLEYDLREELSQIFNACIHVRRCLYRNADSMNENQSLKCN
ncbi:unnamed protein product, partial [Oppiella nova]